MRTGLLPSVLLVAGVVAATVTPTVAGATTADGDDSVQVILLSIDALDPAELDELGDGDNPLAPTLNELRDQGTWWTEARGVMASETLPNHIAMGTGTYPGRNGVPGNDGRLNPGDTEVADPDLGLPEARLAVSTIAAAEAQCPDLRTVTSLSKEYVWRTFVGEADVDFDQESANIPGSGHAPETATVPFILNEQASEPIDLLFANLGDHDRAGHIDESGALPDGPSSVVDGPRAGQRAALAQVDRFVLTIVEQLKQSGEWDRTVLLLVSDHSMTWSPSDPSGQWNVDVAGALEAVETANDREPGSTFLFSDNGGAGFLYLVDPQDPDRETLLEEAYDTIAAMDGVEEVLYRLPAAFDPDGAALSTVHPEWNLHQTERVGEILVLVGPRHRAGSFSDNPIPGNHGHVITRHITALVTGGWDGIAAGQVIEASDPNLVDVGNDTELLPEQAEQVDWAPTIGWLLGIEDPGLAAGGEAQWQGRVLEEAFTRRPGTLACAAADATDAPDTVDDEAAAPEPDVTDDDEETGDLAATGGGTALLGVLLLGSVVAVGRRRRD